MQFEKILKEWRSGKAKSIYVFHGEEEFERTELLRTAPDLFVPDEATRSFNFDLLYGSETSLAQVVSVAEGYPMMAERRLVIVREADRILRAKTETSSSKKGKSKPEDSFLNYLGRPNPETVLIFDMQKFGARNTTPFKQLSELATVIEFPLLKEGEVSEWLTNRAKELGKNLPLAAAKLMVAHLGVGLRTHANELDKLIIFIGNRVEISAQDVEQVVGVSREHNIFELTKAIGAGKKGLSIEIALRMIAQDKDQRQMILVMLARFVEQMVLAREMDAKGKTEKTIAEALELRGGAAFFVKEIISQARRYTRERLDGAMTEIVQSEARSRYVPVGDALFLESLITFLVPI